MHVAPADHMRYLHISAEFLGVFHRNYFRNERDSNLID